MPQHSMAPMLFGLRVVMLGRWGSGKGTQGVPLGCGRIYSVERARGLETWTCGACRRGWRDGGLRIQDFWP